MTADALVDFAARCVYVSETEVLPLADFWNDDGECNWADATHCSAGPDIHGLFVQIDLTKKQALQ